MDDLQKTIQLLNQNTGNSGRNVLSLSIDGIRNVAHSILYDVDNFEHITIELRFYDQVRQLKSIVKRESNDATQPLDIYLNEDRDPIVLEKQLDRTANDDLLQKLLNEEQPSLQVELFVKFQLDKEELHKVKTRYKKFQEERSFIYDINVKALSGKNTDTADIESYIKNLSNEPHGANGEPPMRIFVNLRLQEPIIKEIPLEAPIELESLKSVVEPSFKIENVIKMLIKKAKSLIPKLLDDYNIVIGSNANYDDFKKFNAFTDQQKNNLLNNRKYNYLKELFSTSKHSKIHALLLSSIDELVYDRVSKKRVDLDDNREIEKMLHKTQFKINKILEYTIQKYFTAYQDRVPFDILHANQYRHKEAKKQLASFSDTDEFFYMKLKEYEKVGLYHITEKMLKERLVADDTNGKTWHGLCMYYLRRQNFELAETAHWKVLQIEQPSSYLKTLTVCFYLQRGHIKRAYKQLSMNLDEDKWSTNDNLLMSFIHETYLEKPKIAKKYFNVARKKLVKSAENKFGKNGNKAGKKEAVVAEEVWKELVMYLLKNFFVDVASKILVKFEIKAKFKRMIEGNIQSIKGNYNESNAILSEFVDKDADSKQEIDGYYSEAMLTTAYNCYFLNNHYEAELHFLKYIDYTSSPSIYEVLLVLGYSYLKRNAFEEANLIFKKLVKLNKRSVCAWLGLAVTTLNMDNGEEEHVIEVLMNALKLDRLNTDIPLYLLIHFCQTYDGSKYHQKCLKKMFSILQLKEIENLHLLDEIAKYFKNIGGADMESLVNAVTNKNKARFENYRINLEWLSKQQIFAEVRLNSI